MTPSWLPHLKQRHTGNTEKRSGVNFISQTNGDGPLFDVTDLGDIGYRIGIQQVRTGQLVSR